MERDRTIVTIGIIILEFLPVSRTPLLLILKSDDKSSIVPNFQASIIHFAGEVSPYKAWDLLFDDIEIEKYSILHINRASAPNFIVNKEINELSKIWWSYAEKTPVYNELMLEMNAKKEWFKRGISGYLKRIVAIL